MNETLTGAALAEDLSASARELASLAARVERESESQPRIESSGWSGPTSWACELALGVLRHDLDTALEQLRAAVGLTELAAWEAQSHA